MEPDVYKKARERVQELRAFYTHLITYIIVNIGLAIINLLTNPDELWFYWVTIFWGIGLLFHAVSVFIFGGRFLGREWEERKVQQLVEKEEKKRKAG